MSKKTRRIILYIVGTIVFFALVIASAWITAKIQSKPAKEETTSNNATVENSAINGSTGNVPEDGTEAVTLNTGKTYVKGDTDVTLEAPTYYEGASSYIGTITNLYPETGRILLRTRTGVVVINYRHVVDIHAQTKTWIYDGPAENEVIDASMRGVVYLDTNGKEQLHFLRNLDDDSFMGNYSYEIQSMQSYDNEKYYDVFMAEEEIPEEIQMFYDSF